MILSRITSIAILLSALACATTEDFELKHDPTYREIMGSKPPTLPLRVAVLPIMTKWEGDWVTHNATIKNKFTWAWPIDLNQYLLELVEPLSQASGANSFARLEPFGEPVIYNKKKEIDPTTRGELLDRCWLQKFDVMMEVHLRRYYVAWDDTVDTIYPLNVANWVMFWAPSWWVTDERYRAEIELEVVLWDVNNGNELCRKNFEIVKKRRLDDFQRGWMLYGIVRVPEALAEPNWKKVHENVMPLATKQLRSDFLAWFSGRPLRRPDGSPDPDPDLRSIVQSEPFAARMHKRMSFSVGIRDYQHLDDLFYAQNDGNTVNGFMVDMTRGGLRSRDTFALFDSAANRTEILTALDELADRALEWDTIFFYYSGYGAMIHATPEDLAQYMQEHPDAALPDPDRAFLVPYNGKLEGDLSSLRANFEEQVVSIELLGQRLQKVKARRVVVVLDTAFNGNQLGRSLTDKLNPERFIAGQGLFEQRLYELLDGGRQRTLLCVSSTVGESAYEHSDFGHGIFTYYFYDQGARELKGDLDHDGQVTFGEAWTFATKVVEDQTRIEGIAQTPIALGPDGLISEGFGKVPQPLQDFMDAIVLKKPEAQTGETASAESK